MTRILIVEDERHLADGLRFNLEAEGYGVDVVETGEAALETLLTDDAPYGLAVLDVMLPGTNGFTVVEELRRAGRYLPVLMLTARGHPEDVLRGFAAGADDYLPKPFELKILIARIRGLLRRTEWVSRAGPGASRPAVAGQDRFTFAGRTIDFSALEVQRGERRLPLTLMEANLLRFLVRHEGRTVSRKAILEQVWGVREDTDTRAIDNFIVRLRRYLEDRPSEPKHLLTVRSVGYRFVAKPATD
jgi:two-component system, OmpR family, alkaline phosphatase synthesis response regulator PhoP